MDVSQIRRNGSKDFITFYTSLCALQSSCPISNIKSCAKEGVLNCHLHSIDRLDLHPILTALRVNTVLHTVVFYNKWQEKAYHHYAEHFSSTTRIPKRTISKQLNPDHCTSSDIVKATSTVLTISSAITSLIIEGVPMNKSNFKLLLKGLQENISLKHLSLKGSFIGDSNVAGLCKILKTDKPLEWLDLTCCGLTGVAIQHILTILRHQSVNRQTSVWKDTLRGQRPHYSSLPGLRRITLNINPEIGDEGACELAMALQDDIWIKAIDLQLCGLSNTTVNAFMEILPSNNSLMVLDLRDNEDVDDDILDSITDSLSSNVAKAQQTDETYRWIDVESSKIAQEFKAAGIPVIKSINRRKSTVTIKTASSTSVTGKHSASNHHLHKTHDRLSASRSYQKWKRHSNKPSDVCTSRSLPNPSHPVSTSTSNSLSSCQRLSTGSSKSNREDDVALVKRSQPIATNSSTEATCSNCHRPPEGMVTLTIEQFKEIKGELEHCHTKLRQEAELRNKLEVKVLEIQVEKEILQKKLDAVRIEKRNKETSRNPLEMEGIDEQTLDTIESTFQQFHLFLDSLKENGYGHLTELLNCKI